MREHSRRRFVAHSSLAVSLAALVQISPQFAPSGSSAEAQSLGSGDPFDAFILDTMRALSVVVMPGPDEWSRVQGTPREAPGPIEARGGEFLQELFDNYLGSGDQLARPLALGIGEALNDLGITAQPFLGLSENAGRSIDEVLGYEYSDRVLPLSLLVALVLNFGALLVKPTTIAGPLGSPFSRLSIEEKCRVIEGVERPIPQLLDIFDRSLPVPLRGSASGFLRFAGGILLDGAAFATHSEMFEFDPRSKEVTGTPPSWAISAYRPSGLVDGHPEFIGYYQDRMEVPADA